MGTSSSRCLSLSHPINVTSSATSTTASSSSSCSCYISIPMVHSNSSSQPIFFRPHKSIPTSTTHRHHLKNKLTKTMNHHHPSLPSSSPSPLPLKCGRQVEIGETRDGITAKTHTLNPDLLHQMVYDALVWSSLHGLLVGDKSIQNSGSVPGVGIVHAPFSLLPVPFPESHWTQACELTPIFNELVDRVSSDGQFLQEALSSTKKADAFTSRLLDIHSKMLEMNKKEEIVLGLHRSDYMVDDRTKNLLQIELNTISSSFAGLSCVVSELHRALLNQYGKFIGLDSTRVPQNAAVSQYAEALATAWKEYNHPRAVVLIVVQTEERNIEGSARGFGIRVAESTEGLDSWADDPITRHIISLSMNKEGHGDNLLVWPLILHIKSHYYILVLPLVEPQHLTTYGRMIKRSDCGNSISVEESLSSLLLELPSITGAFMVAHAIGDVITGDLVEPEVVVSASPSVGGLLDSLTGSIGISSISARAKPTVAPVAASTTSSVPMSGVVASDIPKTSSRLVDKDALRNFISSAMPFGTPLDLNYFNISSIKINGFSASDMPPGDLKQPAWKPYLYKGKQRILFTIHEMVYAAMYDRDEIPDNISISGQVSCRAELEGLPDISFPLTSLNKSRVEVLSFHPCAQVSEHGVDKQAMMFSPPLGNFVLMRYQALCGLGPPIKGFYQLSMVSEDEGAFLFKLRLMEGYKAPLSMEFCTLTMPFPRRRVVSFEGNPSIGTISVTEHSVEWKIIASGKSITGKSIEATFPGTVRFAPRPTQRPVFLSGSINASVIEEDSDIEPESANNMMNIEEFLMEKMNKDLPSVELEEPFCWQAYNYAKVSFKITGGALSGMSVDPKSVTIYPAVKAPVEFSTQVVSGDYILWNTLGKCPFVATVKD